ncbi:Uncharacterised protein g7518 [Pycnogonum litorale]
MRVRTTCPFLFLVYNLMEIVNGFNFTYSPSKLDALLMGSERVVTMMLCNKSSSFDVNSTLYTVRVFIEEQRIASVVGKSTKKVKLWNKPESCKMNFTIKGNLIGKTTAGIIKCKKSLRKTSTGGRYQNRNSDSSIDDVDGEDDETDIYSLPIIVVVGDSTIGKAFTYSVIILVTLAYVNMGCTIDTEVVKSVIKKPIAPVIGLLCQYVCMPLISFGFATLFFPGNNSVLKMGLFTLGCSPGGGGSNMWTYLLGGNLNLSITMTFISTLVAIGMMPLWMLTLGRTLFAENNVKVPYKNLLLSLIALIIPIGIGLLIKRFKPRIAEILSKMLAPISILLIIYIVCFGVYAKFYIFYFFTWRVVVGSMCTIWCGFAVGFLTSFIFRFSKENIIAVTIETGIQNTGIAIVLLLLSLPDPDRDIAAVVPVAASIMMPIPLIIVFVYQKIHACIRSKQKNVPKLANSLSETGTNHTLVLTPEDCDVDKKMMYTDIL